MQPASVIRVVSTPKTIRALAATSPGTASGLRTRGLQTPNRRQIPANQS